mmetsp:Transcript_19654/g.32445  ORF Transcript_19654/g.32445 Transcript_19654/m.32445 type:complete len:90 (-) Transcript_19654:1381-1650(-)
MIRFHTMPSIGSPPPPLSSYLRTPTPFSYLSGKITLIMVIVAVVVIISFISTKATTGRRSSIQQQRLGSVQLGNGGGVAKQLRATFYQN